MRNIGKRLAAAVAISVMALAGGIAAAPASAATTLTCDLNVQNPHGSVHYTGTINVVAVTTCPVAMTSIFIEVQLERQAPTQFVWPGKEETTLGKKTAQGNAASPCSAGPGTFVGWARTRIVPPAGYVLTGSGTIAKFGTSLGVACGLSKSITAIEAEPVHITFEKVS